jgi:hypothetical protein
MKLVKVKERRKMRIAKQEEEKIIVGVQRR